MLLVIDRVPHFLQMPYASHSSGATCSLPSCILLHLWKGSSRSSSRAPAQQRQRRRARAFDRRYSRGASPPSAQHRRVVGGFSCAPLVRTQPYLQPKGRAPRRTARQADAHSLAVDKGRHAAPSSRLLVPRWATTCRPAHGATACRRRPAHGGNTPIGPRMSPT